MNVKLDTKADALYIKLGRGKIHKTVAHGNGYIVDLDRKGGVVGIEILRYSQTVRGAATKLPAPVPSTFATA